MQQEELAYHTALETHMCCYGSECPQKSGLVKKMAQLHIRSVFVVDVGCPEEVKPPIQCNHVKLECAIYFLYLLNTHLLCIKCSSFYESG